MSVGNYAEELARTVMARYPEADSYPYRSWSYPQGYLLMGFAKLWKITGKKEYYDYIYRYCDGHVNEQGEISGFTGCSMDDMMAGAVLVWMYEQTEEERFALACRRIRDSFRDYPRTREGGFLHMKDRFPGEMWVDGVFMGQMFLCRYGKVFGEPDCFAEAVRQLQIIYRYCHTHDGLLAHGYSQDNLAAWAGADGKAPCVWSEGLGWYALILTEALDLIPPETEGYGEVQGQLVQLVHGLKQYQDPQTGLWFQVVDRGGEPDNWCDTSGSGMFLYAVKRAVDAGRVDRDGFEPVVRRAYQGLLTRAVRGDDGLLDIVTACEGLCIQESYEVYVNYPQKVNAQEAVCSFLWGVLAVELGHE